MKRLLFLAALLPLLAGCQCPADRTPNIIAHRGYWKTENSAQNSRSSVQNAITAGCWGAEIDVYLTPDNRVVLMHDPSYKGYKMEATPYDTLQNVTLSNGETIPTLEEILGLITHSKTTKLIIEIKAHSTPELEKAVSNQVVSLVAQANAQKYVEYISFSQVICQAVMAADAHAKVHYLSGDLAPDQLKAQGYAGLDYHMSVLREHPEWIQQAHELGLAVNVWTVNEPDDFAYFTQAHVDYITTNEPTYQAK